MNKSVYEVVTDRIIESLSNGVIPWHKPWVSRAPMNMVSKKPYRGVNTLLLGAMTYQSPWWLTFNQAKNMGGSVRKGEKGMPVVFWSVYEKEYDGKVKKNFVLRYYTVFNASQCDGIEVPEVKSYVNDPIDECENIVKGYRNAPPIINGGNRACYVPSLDRIHMPNLEQFEDAKEYYSTLFHELTHSTGAESRLKRKGVIDPVVFGSHNYAQEELVAECGASFLCAKTEIENKATIENSTAYIQAWIKRLREDPRLIVDAASQAAKGVDLILGQKAGETNEEEAVV